MVFVGPTSVGPMDSIKSSPVVFDDAIFDDAIYFPKGTDFEGAQSVVEPINCVVVSAFHIKKHS